MAEAYFSQRHCNRRRYLACGMKKSIIASGRRYLVSNSLLAWLFHRIASSLLLLPVYLLFSSLFSSLSLSLFDELASTNQLSAIRTYLTVFDIWHAIFCIFYLSKWFSFFLVHTGVHLQSFCVLALCSSMQIHLILSFCTKLHYCSLCNPTACRVQRPCASFEPLISHPQQQQQQQQPATTTFLDAKINFPNDPNLIFAPEARQLL